MAAVLGLDLGSDSVKGVLLEASAKGGGVRGKFAIPRSSEGDRLASLKVAVAQLWEELASKPEQVVVALPGPALATHALTLPFSDPKRVEAALPFEVEAQLPFDLSEAVYDYQLTPTADKRGEVLVGVVRKEELAALLAALAEVGVEPRVVTHPALAYQNLLIGQPQLFEEKGPIAILDIGQERTSFAMGSTAQGVSFARTFSGGGKDLTKALASEFQTSPAEAEAWKLEHGSLLPPETPDAVRVSGALSRGLHPLMRELRASIKAAGARTRQQISAIYLCGGTALLPGLAEQLSRDLAVPVKPLALSQGEGFSPQEALLYAQAYALAQRGLLSGAKAPRFNLRRGEFAFRGHYDYLKERWGRLALYAASILALLIGSGMLRNAVLADREAQVDDALCQVTQRVLGKCERNFDRALSLLRGKESPVSALPQTSAVGLLGDLTNRIPADVTVKFDQIVIDLERISLRGETDSSKQIDRITSALKGHHCFKDVKEGKVERSKDGQKVSFRLDIQVECPEATAVQPG